MMSDWWSAGMQSVYIGIVPAPGIVHQRIMIIMSVIVRWGV